MQTTEPARIELSIVIEGYNETLEIGCIDETMQALRSQRHALDAVEVLVVGSAEQAAAWRTMEENPAPFAAIRVIETDGDHYYALKNRGAATACGEILAFLDSDVMPEPEWMGTLLAGIREGADATCGPSLFRQGDPATARSLPMLVAASISWSFIVGAGAKAQGFLSHNLGFRKEVFERLRYRTDFGRTCAGSFLMDDMRKAGINPVFQPRQQVAHAFLWRWWFMKLHVRFGHEVYLLHRMESGTVSGIARWMGPLDAVVTPAWHVILDFPKWWRYSGILGLPLWRRVAGVALVLPLSLLARGGEACGMIATLFAPERMRAFAAEN
jgi:glycosyltransferase involved in cell wall biosynthesis